MSGDSGIRVFYRGKVDHKVRVSEHRLATQEDTMKFSKEWLQFRNSEDERKHGHPLDPVFFQSPPPVQNTPINDDIEDHLLEIRERRRPKL
jgi:hypothetical protein